VRIGAVLSPVPEFGQVLDAARAADEAGLDAVGLWDHYHSQRPEWGYVAGWAALGAIVAVTERVHVVPMVINSLNYELGTIAKESSILALASGGRFELGIGAGDWPESFAAWGRTFPSLDDRQVRLAEKVAALRRIWSGESITMKGRHVELAGAICTPAPISPVRVVVGAGKSHRIAADAIGYADEINLYDDPELIATTRRLAESSGIAPAVSVFLDWSMGQWPADHEARIQRLRAQGIDRAFVSIGGSDMPARIASLAGLASRG
jgi:alkanesulfonate monooxygenase SsuD/methylene tetrahydromethanopterin reductase-like flavin-dependent oxidoreductase (luciferase family)